MFLYKIKWCFLFLGCLSHKWCWGSDTINGEVKTGEKIAKETDSGQNVDHMNEKRKTTERKSNETKTPHDIFFELEMKNLKAHKYGYQYMPIDDRIITPLKDQFKEHIGIWASFLGPKEHRLGLSFSKKESMTTWTLEITPTIQQVNFTNKLIKEEYRHDWTVNRNQIVGFIIPKEGVRKPSMRGILLGDPKTGALNNVFNLYLFMDIRSTFPNEVLGGFVEITSADVSKLKESERTNIDDVILSKAPPLFLEEKKPLTYYINIRWIDVNKEYKHHWKHTIMTMREKDKHMMEPWLSQWTTFILIIILSLLSLGGFIYYINKNIDKIHQSPKALQNNAYRQLLSMNYLAKGQYPTIFLVILTIGIKMLILQILLLIAFLLKVINSFNEFRYCLYLILVVAGALGGHFSSKIYFELGGDTPKKFIIYSFVLAPFLALMQIFIIDLVLCISGSVAIFNKFEIFSYFMIWVSSIAVIEVTKVLYSSEESKNELSQFVRKTGIVKSFSEHGILKTEFYSMIIGSLIIIPPLSQLLYPVFSHYYDMSMALVARDTLFSILLVMSIQTVLTIIFSIYIINIYKNRNWCWISYISSLSPGFGVLFYATYYYLLYISVWDMSSAISFFLHVLMTAIVVSISIGSISFYITLIVLNRLQQKLRTSH